MAVFTITITLLVLLQQQGQAFVPTVRTPTKPTTVSQLIVWSTSNKKHHQFNGGYDASQISVMWTPLQAAEFIIWHDSSDTHSIRQAGEQLQPLIQHWSGTQVGEFLTRLYLGEISGKDDKLTFESRHVRTPQWKGLSTHEGLLALQELLRAALPDSALEPAEIARLAESFLLKEHTWPSTNTIANHHHKKHPPTNANSNTTTNTDNPNLLERDSFASLGHASHLGMILGDLRQERFGEWTADHVLDMVIRPEKDDRLLQLHDFFTHLGIRVTATEKIDLVKGMAQSGWGPASIAKFVSHIIEMQEPAPLPQLLPESLGNSMHQEECRIVEENDGDNEKKNQATPFPASILPPSWTYPSSSKKLSSSSSSSKETKQDDNKLNISMPKPHLFGAANEYFAASIQNSNSNANNNHQNSAPFPLSNNNNGNDMKNGQSTP